MLSLVATEIILVGKGLSDDLARSEPPSSEKGQRVHIFSFVGRMVPAATIQPQHCSTKAALDNG